ncbi:aromatic ring-hydroxylating dioxygenase subunit alpha, partial [Gluconacetobacter sacchari]
MTMDQITLAARADAGIGAPDLRTVDCDPDFWYPVAWSRELKAGKTIGTRYA